MVDADHAMRIIINAIGLDDIMEDHIWFTGEEHKVDTVDYAYSGTMLMSAICASDFKLEAEAKTHSHRAKLLSNIVDNFTNGRLVILTAVDHQIPYCSTNQN